jgi:adenosylcobyric acid synthase
MQMLGETILDPLGMEHDGSVEGLGLLPIRTIMQADKVTRNASGEMTTKILFGQHVTGGNVSGYEIHIGQTIYGKGVTPFAALASDSEPSGVSADGCVRADSRVFGTYLHGLFDDDGFRHQFIRAARAFYQLSAPDELFRCTEMRKESLNRLAREVERALDMTTIFSWVGLHYNGFVPAEEAREVSRRETVSR